MVLVAALAGFAVAGVVRLRDRAAAMSAAVEVEQALGVARAAALAWRTGTVVRVDTVAGRLEVRRGAAILRVRDLGAEYGVRLGASRDSVGYDARGFGHGAANATLVVRRGSASESVFVSRLGRVRR